MTEIALQGSTELVGHGDPTGGRLAAWASSLFAAKQIADALCDTTFAPAHFRGKPADGAAAIMFGDEIGFTPTQALRSVFVISGTPALYARAMVALVLSHGHTVETVEKTDAKVTVRGRRRGSSHTIEETWTTARATKAGYTKNSKYATDPQAMLYARAAADICRQIAPDALAGLAFTVEEMELAEPEPTTTVRRLDTAPPKRVQRALAPVPEEPPLEDEPARPVEDREVIGELITAPQMKKLHASLNDQGITDRDVALGFMGDTLGRTVDSSKTLTKDEAREVIDRLESLNTESTPEPEWPATPEVGA